MQIKTSVSDRRVEIVEPKEYDVTVVVNDISVMFTFNYETITPAITLFTPNVRIKDFSGDVSIKLNDVPTSKSEL
jgi:hypothetical protein